GNSAVDQAPRDGAHRPAPLAEKVLVMLTACLEPGLAVPKLDLVHRAFGDHPPKRPVDGRKVGIDSALPQRGGQVLDRPVVSITPPEKLGQGWLDMTGTGDGEQASSYARHLHNRAWLGQKQAKWLTPKRLRWITAGLLTVAVLVSGTLSGS